MQYNKTHPWLCTAPCFLFIFLFICPPGGRKQSAWFFLYIKKKGCEAINKKQGKAKQPPAVSNKLFISPLPCFAKLAQQRQGNEAWRRNGKDWDEWNEKEGVKAVPGGEATGRRPAALQSKDCRSFRRHPPPPWLFFAFFLSAALLQLCCRSAPTLAFYLCHRRWPSEQPNKVTASLLLTTGG